MDDTTLTVTEPLTICSDKGKHTSYLISLETKSPVFSRGQSRVRRRYSDFIWLRKELLQNNPDVKLHKLPPKTLFSSRFDPCIIESRREGLQVFLQGCLPSTLCLSHSALHLFLQSGLSVEEMERCLAGTSEMSITDAILLSTNAPEINTTIPTSGVSSDDRDVSTTNSMNVPEMAPDSLRQVFSPTRPQSKSGSTAFGFENGNVNQSAVANGDIIPSQSSSDNGIQSDSTLVKTSTTQTIAEITAGTRMIAEEIEGEEEVIISHTNSEDDMLVVDDALPSVVCDIRKVHIVENDNDNKQKDTMISVHTNTSVADSTGVTKQIANPETSSNKSIDLTTESDVSRPIATSTDSKVSGSDSSTITINPTTTTNDPEVPTTNASQTTTSDPVKDIVSPISSTDSSDSPSVPVFPKKEHAISVSAISDALVEQSGKAISSPDTDSSNDVSSSSKPVLCSTEMTKPSTETVSTTNRTETPSTEPVISLDETSTPSSEAETPSTEPVISLDETSTPSSEAASQSNELTPTSTETNSSLSSQIATPSN